MNNTDKEYFRLLDLILAEGRIKKNRTGIDTKGVFGAQAKFNLEEGFPILTTKKVWMKGIVHELLWFIKGETNIKYLVDNDVHIWDEWAYKKFKENSTIGNIEYLNAYQNQASFINKIKELPANDWFVEKFGDLGEGTYGGMWRDFPVHIKEGNGTTVLGIDQLQSVVDKIKSNPDDRRLIVSAWHPYYVNHCALPPCHCLFHFNTEELNFIERMKLGALKGVKWNEETELEFDRLNIPKRRLNLLLYQRSCDSGLGIPFNISSYSLLLFMVAHVTNMQPGIFTHTYGDLHIYQNHIEGLKEQRTRIPFELPKLWLNPEVKSLFDFKYDDIKLINYQHHPSIKFDVAV